MEVTLERIMSDQRSTLGVLYLDAAASCFVLEDTFREVKVPGETRIPAGRYRLRLRKIGESPKFDKRYTEKFGVKHRGMIEIEGVPNYQGILIHTGNIVDDTAGCPLVGMTVQNYAPFVIGNSTVAYRRIYEKLSEALAAVECWITILDRDR